MEKTATLNLRVNPAVKQRAEDVLTRLGIPMSTAIDVYLNLMSLTREIPFAVALPNAPSVLNADFIDYKDQNIYLDKDICEFFLKKYKRFLRK